MYQLSMTPKIGNVIKTELFGSFRDVSIIYSVDELLINTEEHFNNATRDYDIPVEINSLKP